MQTQSVSQDDDTFLSSWMVPVWRQGRGWCWWRLLLIPQQKQGGTTCAGLWEGRRMQEAVGCSVLMLWISLCSLACPCSGLWLRHTSLPWPLVEPGPWLAHWLAHRGGNQVQAFYKPIINIFDTYNLWNLANQDLIWFISCFLPFI